MVFDTAGVLTSPTTPFVFDAFTPPSGGQQMALSVDHGVATTQQSGPFIRYSGTGQIADQSRAGWLQRFFAKVAPL